MKEGKCRREKHRKKILDVLGEKGRGVGTVPNVI